MGRFAGKIYEEAQRLFTLVEDILNLSHLDEGAPGQERRQGIDLYALCARAVARLEEAARQRGIAIALTGSRCRVDGAEKLLEEIIFTSATTPSNIIRRTARWRWPSPGAPAGGAHRFGHGIGIPPGEDRPGLRALLPGG